MNERGDHFHSAMVDPISSTKIKILDFFLTITSEKLEDFMRLDEELRGLSQKDTSQVGPEDIKSITRMVKSAIQKNVFAKAILRDAWVNTRLKCLHLLRLANSLLDSIKMEQYTECIREFKKEIDNRIKTHEDEEVNVFYVLFQMQTLKIHVRNHNFDAFIREYDSLQLILKKIKHIEFGKILLFRVEAAMGYAAKLIENDILVESYLLQASEIYEVYYETKKQITCIDSSDRFIYYFIQLNLCKLTQRKTDTLTALDQAEKILKKLNTRKSAIKGKPELIQQFKQFIDACMSFLQPNLEEDNEEQVTKIFNPGKGHKKQIVKSILENNKALIDDSTYQNSQYIPFLPEQLKNELNSAAQPIKYSSAYKTPDILKNYLNNIEQKRESQKNGIERAQPKVNIEGKQGSLPIQSIKNRQQNNISAQQLSFHSRQDLDKPEKKILRQNESTHTLKQDIPLKNSQELKDNLISDNQLHLFQNALVSKSTNQVRNTTNNINTNQIVRHVSQLYDDENSQEHQQPFEQLSKEGQSDLIEKNSSGLLVSQLFARTESALPATVTSAVALPPNNIKAQTQSNQNQQQSKQMNSSQKSIGQLISPSSLSMFQQLSFDNNNQMKGVKMGSDIISSLEDKLGLNKSTTNFQKPIGLHNQTQSRTTQSMEFAKSTTTTRNPSTLLLFEELQTTLNQTSHNKHRKLRANMSQSTTNSQDHFNLQISSIQESSTQQLNNLSTNTQVPSLLFNNQKQKSKRKNLSIGEYPFTQQPKPPHQKQENQRFQTQESMENINNFSPTKTTSTNLMKFTQQKRPKSATSLIKQSISSTSSAQNPAKQNYLKSYLDKMSLNSSESLQQITIESQPSQTLISKPQGIRAHFPQALQQSTQATFPSMGTDPLFSNTEKSSPETIPRKFSNQRRQASFSAIKLKTNNSLANEIRITEQTQSISQNINQSLSSVGSLNQIVINSMSNNINHKKEQLSDSIQLNQMQKPTIFFKPNVNPLQKNFSSKQKSLNQRTPFYTSHTLNTISSPRTDIPSKHILQTLPNEEKESTFEVIPQNLKVSESKLSFENFNKFLSENPSFANFKDIEDKYNNNEVQRNEDSSDEEADFVAPQIKKKLEKEKLIHSTITQMENLSQIIPTEYTDNFQKLDQTTMFEINRVALANKFESHLIKKQNFKFDFSNLISRKSQDNSISKTVNPQIESCSSPDLIYLPLNNPIDLNPSDSNETEELHTQEITKKKQHNKSVSTLPLKSFHRLTNVEVNFSPRNLTSREVNSVLAFQKAQKFNPQIATPSIKEIKSSLKSTTIAQARKQFLTFESATKGLRPSSLADARTLLPTGQESKEPKTVIQPLLEQPQPAISAVSAFLNQPKLSASSTRENIQKIMNEIEEAKTELNQTGKQELSKQHTLFSMNSPKSGGNSPSNSIVSSLFKKAKPSTFKKTYFTKNSFDSEKSVEEEVAPIQETKQQKKSMLKRQKVYDEISDDEIEEPPSLLSQGPSLLTPQQNPNQQRRLSLGIGLKSITSIASMIISKKNWFNVQNREMNPSISKGSPRQDAMEKRIIDLNIRFPVVSFCSHRIGRFQSWKIHYVDYFKSNQCFQINFLSLDNLFYKMFIPVKIYQNITFEKGKFMTIWPIILEYLLEYLESKKIVLKFNDQEEKGPSKKIKIIDFGLNQFFENNNTNSFQESNNAFKIAQQIKEFKKNGPQPKDMEFDKSLDNSSEIGSDRNNLSSGLRSPTQFQTEKNNKNQPKFNFFLGLVKKDSYFPTLRDAVAAAKIKRIFEILLYRYMYDILRPTGKKLVLKKDASTQKYKTLSKRIQKLENDLQKSETKSILRRPMKTNENTVDSLMKQKFGTTQLRKLVQKDVMKIPDKQEYQIEQIWKLRYKETPYQLCSFIKKTSEGHYYLVSLCVALKKNHNALLAMFMKKNQGNKGLSGQFDKIIQVQRLFQPSFEKSSEEANREKTLKEFKSMSLVDQQMAESQLYNRFIDKKQKLIRNSTSSLIQTVKPTNEKTFPDEELNEILTTYDINQIIRDVAFSQKIPKNFKQFSIKNLNRRIVITENLLFLKLDRAEILKRKTNKNPPILVQQELPENERHRFIDFDEKNQLFENGFDLAYKKSEFGQAKPVQKNTVLDQSMDDGFSDLNEDSFNAYYYPNPNIKQSDEEFELFEKIDKNFNQYYEELDFQCRCERSFSSQNQAVEMYYQKNGIKYKVIAELHGLFDPNSLGRSEDNTNTAHLNIRITSLETRYFKFYSTNKVKALLLFSSYFNHEHEQKDNIPIVLPPQKKNLKRDFDFASIILIVSKRKTIPQLASRAEIHIRLLSILPSHEALKLSLLRKQSVLEVQRSHKKYSIIDSIQSFGKAVIIMTVYHDQEQGFFFFIEFSDLTSKSKQFRMALNENDLADLFEIKLFLDDSTDIYLRVLRRITYHIRLSSTNLYRVPFFSFSDSNYRRGLELNLRNYDVERKKWLNQLDMKNRLFCNRIIKHNFEKENLNITREKYFVDSQRKHSRVIFHKPFIVRNQYLILTIEKSLNFSEFWMVFIYSPKSGRRIKGYLQSKDFEQIQFSDNIAKDIVVSEYFDLSNNQSSFLEYQHAIINRTFLSQARENRSNLKERTQFLRIQVKKLSQMTPGVRKNPKTPKEGSDRKFPQSEFQSRADIGDDDFDEDNDDPYYNNHQFSDENHQPNPIHSSPNLSPNIYDRPVVIPAFILKRHEKRLGTPVHLNQATIETRTETQTRIILAEKFHMITAQISHNAKNSTNISIINGSRFAEIHCWLDMVAKMELMHMSGTMHKMKMGSLSIPMQEFISSGQIVTDHDQELFVEYFLGKDKDSMGDEFISNDNEELSYSTTLDWYIYIRIYFYEKPGIMHKRINLRELLNLFIADGYYKYQTNYMHSKLQQQDIVQLCEFISYKIIRGTFPTILNQNQSQFPRSKFEGYSRKTLHTLVKEQEKTHYGDSITNQFIFTTMPYRIVNVSIKRAKRVVECVVYTPSNSSTFKQSYSIRKLQRTVPFIDHYFQAGLFRELASHFLTCVYSDLHQNFINSLNKDDYGNV